MIIIFSLFNKKKYFCFFILLQMQRKYWFWSFKHILSLWRCLSFSPSLQRCKRIIHEADFLGGFWWALRCAQCCWTVLTYEQLHPWWSGTVAHWATLGSAFRLGRAARTSCVKGQARGCSQILFKPFVIYTGIYLSSKKNNCICGTIRSPSDFKKKVDLI